MKYRTDRFVMGLLVALATCTFAFANESTRSQSTQTTSTQNAKTEHRVANASIQIAATQSESLTVEVLKAQVQLMKEFDGRIIATVYWALGTLGTVTVALLAFGWWTNIRLTEREFRLLAMELRSNNQQDFQRLQQAVETHANETIRQVIDSAIAEKITPSITKLDSAVAQVWKDTIGLKYQAEIAAAKTWKEQNVLGNVVAAYASACLYSLQLKDIFKLQSALEGVLNAFRSRKEKQLVIGKIARLELVDVLDNAPKEVADLIQAVRKELNDSA